MKINWTTAILAGITGTLAFDLLGLLLTGTWWDIPGLLSAKLGTGLTMGVAGHYANGVALAVIYTALAPSLFGPRWFRAISYVTVQTILGVWMFMLPLLDMGIAGTKVSMMIPVITLARHWAFGAALIVFIKVQTAKQAKRVDVPLMKVA